MVEIMCLEAYKKIYADIILSKENTLMLKELKKLVEGKDNNFEEVFLQNTDKTATDYQKENEKRLTLGNTISKFFRGSFITEEEMNTLEDSSAKDKMKAIELVSFLNLQEHSKLDIFFENDRAINEFKNSSFEDSVDISYTSSYIDELMNLGNTLFKYYSGEELTPKELKTISSFDDQDKFDSMILVAPTALSLKQDEKDRFISSEKTLNYRIDIKNSKKC